MGIPTTAARLLPATITTQQMETSPAHVEPESPVLGYPIYLNKNYPSPQSSIYLDPVPPFPMLPEGILTDVHYKAISEMAPREDEEMKDHIFQPENTAQEGAMTGPVAQSAYVTLPSQAQSENSDEDLEGHISQFLTRWRERNANSSR